MVNVWFEYMMTMPVCVLQASVENNVNKASVYSVILQ